MRISQTKSPLVIKSSHNKHSSIINHCGIPGKIWSRNKMGIKILKILEDGGDVDTAAHATAIAFC